MKQFKIFLVTMLVVFSFIVNSFATITDLPARNEYTATAGQTTFFYTFKIFEDTDILVYVTPSGQAADDTTDIVTPSSVGGEGDEDGGTVTIAATSAGDLVTLVSNIPSNREVNYRYNGDFRPTVVNADFDRVVSIAKQVEDIANRTLVSEKSQQNAVQLSLPGPDAGLYMRWKTDETGLENAGLPSVTTPEINHASVADMQASTTLVIGDVVQTVAYYSTQDGGSALYEIVVAGTGSDDGGLFIDLSGSSLQAKLLNTDNTNVMQWGAKGDDSTDDYATLLAYITSGLKNLSLASDKTYITSDELSIPAGVTLDLNGSTVKADPTLPNTSNIILIDAAGVTVKSGKVNGNKANLINSFASGAYGNGVLVRENGPGAKVIDMETFDCPTNGQGALAIGAGLDDVLFQGYKSHGNTFTGIGGEASQTGSPLTNIRFYNGETYANELGGDIRIQGITNFIISGHNGHDGLHGGGVIGVGEGKNITTGRIINSKIGNAQAGLDTLSIDALVGGSGPNAGQKEELVVEMIGVELVGPGANTGLRVQNDAVVYGSTVTATNHSINFQNNSGGKILIDGISSLVSIGVGIQLDSYAELNNVIVEEWGSTSDGILYTANASNSITQNCRLGAISAATGAHTGLDDLSIMSDGTASFIINEFVDYYIRNTTDGSQGVITSNTATTVTATLAGGTDDDWDTNDEYIITKENGQDGIGISTTPTNITLSINAFTGTRLSLGTISGSVLNTWEIKDSGAKNISEFIDGILAPTAETGRAKVYVDVGDGVYKIMFGDGSIETLGTYVTTTTALDDIASTVNTDGRKKEGWVVWNTTTNKPAWANGSAAGEVWIDATGATTHTPI